MSSHTAAAGAEASIAPRRRELATALIACAGKALGFLHRRNALQTPPMPLGASCARFKLVERLGLSALRAPAILDNPAPMLTASEAPQRAVTLNVRAADVERLSTLRAVEHDDGLHDQPVIDLRV
jgi:hypothetical protein